MLDPILDSLDGLSEILKKEYKKGEGTLEGKFILDVKEKDGWALEDVKGLKSSLSNARSERDRVKQIVKGLGDEFSLEEYQTAMSELETLRKGTKNKKTEDEIEVAKKQLTDKHSKELKSKEDELAQRDAEIAELLITSEATRSLSTHEAISVKALLPHVQTACRVVRDPTTGKPRAVVLGEDGKSPRISMKQGSDKDMSIDEFVESMKKDKEFAPLFKGAGAKGIGTDKGGTPPNNSTTTQSQGSGRSAVDDLREARRAGAA